MKIKFHGARGSVPVSGPDFAGYGGHTTCLELVSDAWQIVVDAGSGFQNVRLLEDRPVILLFSHFHHDHIQGLAFNPDLLGQNRGFFVSSALCDSNTLKGHLQNYFHGAYFPIDLIEAKDRFIFADFETLPASVGSALSIMSSPLNHPGGCVAYSIGEGAERVCTLFDNEYQAEQESRLLDFVDGAGLFIWDGMFTDEELQNRRGWGHSSIEEGMQFFAASRSAKMAIIHHAPSRTDNQLASLQDQLCDPQAFFAREQQVITL